MLSLESRAYGNNEIVFFFFFLVKVSFLPKIALDGCMAVEKKNFISPYISCENTSEKNTDDGFAGVGEYFKIKREE